MELDDALYEQILQLSEEGNRLMDDRRWERAAAVFQQALDLLPPPKNQWEAATWLYGSLGDAYFQNRDFQNAREALLDALNCPDGITNPFLQLRLGETFFELGDLERAREHLLRAYALEGKAIFQEEPAQYLDFLKKHVKLY